MDIGTAIAILVSLAALLTAGILFVLFRALRSLDRIEAAAARLESTALPLLENLRKMTEEIEPVVRGATQRVQSLNDSLERMRQSPVLAVLSLVLPRSPVRIVRGLVAGVSKIREVLRKQPPSRQETPS